MALIELLLAVPRECAGEYYANLSATGQFHLTLHADAGDALAALDDRSQHFDALVVDGGLEGAATLLEEARFGMPHLLTIVVAGDDKPPLEAAHTCTAPFQDGELARQLVNLLSDRQLETLAANTVLPVRRLARHLRRQDDRLRRFQATVEACRSLGYLYSGFYETDEAEPAKFLLAAQSGPPELESAAPDAAGENSRLAQIAARGACQVLGPDDAGAFPLLGDQRLGALACIPCGVAARFGMLLAGRKEADAIAPQHLAVLELIAAQLAAALAREMGS